MANNAAEELVQHLAARHLHPKPAWLQSFLSTQRPNTALAALKQTCLFRLLATDITSSLEQPAASVLPADILNGMVQSRTLAGPIVCQVLDIEDIGKSRWSQVEAMEARERGEMTKGREIVRVIEPENDDSGQAVASTQSKGPFKLLLQDAKGLHIYALDLRGIDGLSTNVSMGAKLLLRNIEVQRAVIMLEPGSLQVLGGKLDALDKAWKDGRKDRLIKAANAGGSAD
ncbi:RecQ mediated genome instability protein Rmi1 [Didymella exigua CBS 183.55]|uniref:RecQ-mediated genome instability protein 1 n=1 Tax=Didymella exigua CBS 183.55 TaxID=1150837 RepID=A0A6A5RPA7_9PLEO|nr:RecQ mediated genome instability protein Rmi1 [Didymella exigua CBS 183.55]KAF1928874.1 RecQ mediated genome instability protein Rmi1 [Didymella exigua CBS 183.55]